MCESGGQAQIGSPTPCVPSPFPRNQAVRTRYVPNPSAHSSLYGAPYLDAGLGLVVPHLHQPVIRARHEVGAVAACKCGLLDSQIEVQESPVLATRHP